MLSEIISKFKSRRIVKPRSYLHSKRRYLNIPLYSIVALLVGIAINGLINNQCFADIPPDEVSGTAEDYTTITPVSGGTTPTPTASLTLSNDDMKSDPTSPGSIATTSTDVTVDVKNASSYSLTLSFEKVDLTNGSTTIVPGNPNDSTSSNVWGYTWDGASTYTTPAVSGNTLIPTTNLSSDTTFTKTLAFGAKFANNADPGEYKTRGTLSLAVSPKAATIITLDNLTQMQQLSLVPEACTNTPYLDGQNYSKEYRLTDVRDGNSYTVRKLGDGRCWMTGNLALSNRHAGNLLYTGGRKLNSTTSDISATSWTLAASSTSGFSSGTASNNYFYNQRGYSYYTWCAATAGTCTSATSDGANASSSICPKGWKLPTGGTSGNTDFYNLFKNMGLTISNSLKTGAGEYTNWGSGDLAKAQGSPYNFAYTGYMNYGSGPQNATSQGRWWSRTANSSNNAYSLGIDSGYVYPGTGYSNRYLGFAVRCVAAEPTIFTLTFDPGNKDNLGLFGIYLAKFKTSYPAQSSPAGYNETSYTFTIPTGDTGYIWGSDGTTGSNATIQGWSKTKDSSTIEYPLGGTITIDASIPDVTLYPVWRIGGGGIA